MPHQKIVNPGIPEIKFFPWIGRDYATGYRGHRLLLLGESEYQRPGSQLEADLVTTLIEKGEFRFYRKVYRAISDGISEDFDTFWRSVAFYNFVQESVGTGPRQRPTPEMWARSKIPFQLLLNYLVPDRVLVLGQGLWCQLWALKLMAPAERGAKSFFLNCDGRNIKTICIRHPSSFGFKPTAWRNIADELLR